MATGSASSSPQASAAGMENNDNNCSGSTGSSNGSNSSSIMLTTALDIERLFLENILTALAGGNSRADGSMIANDTRKKFDLWYFQQVLNRYRQVVTLAAQAQQQHGNGADHLMTMETSSSSSPSESNRNYTLPFDMVESFAKVAAAAQLTDSIIAKTRSPDQQQQSQALHPGNAKLPLLLTNQLLGGSQSAGAANHSPVSLVSQQQQQQQSLSQPHHQQSKQQSCNATGFTRTRIRTSFDPELELPKLQKWFAENHHPSRTQVQHYVDELNSLESRRGRKPLDSNNVVYWFKNARAAHKRQELKGVNGWCSSSSPPAKHDPTSVFGQRNPPDGILCRSLSDVMIGKMTSVDSNNDHDEDEDEDSFDERMDGSEDEEEDNESGTSDAQLNGHNNNKGSHSISSNTSLPCNTSPSSNNSSSNANHNHNNNNHIIISNLNSPDNSPEVCGRVRRSRTFIDPMSEVPRLEQWFAVNTHPTHSQIVKYTDELNQLQYRQKFPKLEAKNIQFWFKNRRAKYKRLSIPPLDLSLTPSHGNATPAALSSTAGGVTTCQVSMNNGPKSSSLSPVIVSGMVPDSSRISMPTHTSDRLSPPTAAAFPVF